MNSAIVLAATREVRERLRRRSFWIFTALLCAAILASGIVFALFVDDDRPSYDVTLAGQAPAGFDVALQHAADATDVEVTLTDPVDVGAAERAATDGAADAVVVPRDDTVLWHHDSIDELASVLDAAWRSTGSAEAVADAGLDDAQAAAILDPPSLDSVVVDPDDDDVVGTLVGFASAILLFISITTFGGFVLTGVVEEKTTGVVEVLLSHVRAHQLLAGKVFGVGAVALVQFTLAIIAGLVSLRISGTTVPSEIWVGLPLTIVWFVGGFLLYSTLFALAGSFVSRMEDAQGAAAPVTSVIMIAYLFVFAFGAVPGSTVARVLSVLPPFSPLLMPLRMVTGAASVVEIVVAAVLLILAVWGMIRLAGSVYSATLLHRGSRLTWRQALKRRSVSTAKANAG